MSKNIPKSAHFSSKNWLRDLVPKMAKISDDVRAMADTVDKYKESYSQQDHTVAKSQSPVQLPLRDADVRYLEDFVDNETATRWLHELENLDTCKSVIPSLSVCWRLMSCPTFYIAFPS